MPARSYVLIAISNVNRASRFRQLAGTTLRLDAVVVRDGEEALQEMSRRGAPALLIVDLSLPRVDGFAVVRKVRRQATDADTRVVVVAAHESLLAAARELSTSLSISSILPIDVDEDTLREALTAEAEAIQGPPPQAQMPASAPSNLRGRATDANDVIERAAIEVRRRFKVPISISYLRTEDDEQMTFQVAALNADATGALGEIGEFKFVKQVADAVEPLVIPSVENHPVFAQSLARGNRPVRGMAAVPVTTSRADVRGALCILDTKALTLDAAEIDALAAFAKSVGAEIDRVLSPHDSGPLDINVEEVKTLQYLASTDPLTGIANRRGGEKHIANEISRAKRERRPLSCVLIDIDRFKHVNDTYGHQAGDALLRDIATLLRRTVRAYDILVRWGGEEFLLVLPGVDLDVARALAERVRVQVEALQTHGIGPVTISGGVAKFEMDYDFASTLKTADQRLYQAKASGRNKIL